MDVTPSEPLLILVLCPDLAPEAHASDCAFQHLFIPPQPGLPGDWSGTVTDLDQIRQRFPGVLFHKCLTDALQYGTRLADAVPDDQESQSSSHERRPRGGHPYGRA